MPVSSPVPHGDDQVRDPLADRRFGYAQAAAGAGAWQEAAELFAQVLDLAPHWIGARVAWGDALLRCDEAGPAENAFRDALERDPGDRHGASLKLAALGATPAPGTAPAAYVGALFDGYAARFDDHLTGALGYRAPAVLARAMSEAGQRSFARAIDLGCGTGLGGAVLRPLADTLTGVDLSSRMVAVARGKNLYDHLFVGDVVLHLAAEPAGGADLVFAADVLVYIGDLAPLFGQAARVLRSGGTLAFTAQSHASDARGHAPNYQVGPDLRFAHAATYIQAALNACGFAPVDVREAAFRQENGRDVAGLVAVASRR